MSLHELFDRVGELTTAPVFDAVDRTALFGDEGLVAFNHRGDLFALVGVHDDADFVVTHLASLRKKPPGASIPVQQGQKGRDCSRNFQAPHEKPSVFSQGALSSAPIGVRQNSGALGPFFPQRPIPAARR